MKSIRNIAFSVLLTMGAFSAVTYTSCNKDECKDVVCNNGGTCTEGICSCPTGYEGTNCQTLSRDKFLGVYKGTETCTIGTDEYTLTITANSDALKITMQNIYNENITATGSVTGTNTFSFSGTQNGATFNGTGSIATNTLTVDYTISQGTINNTCKFIGTK